MLPSSNTAVASPAETVFEMMHDNDITDQVLQEASVIFSENYGVWGPLAESKLGPFAKQGRRIRMSSRKIREQCLPATARNTYIRALVKGELSGNVFAARWNFEGRSICWITQLVVRTEYRRQGLATRLLRKLREGEGESDRGFGILSSHPAAILAALRAFGRGVEEVNLDMAKKRARAIMDSSPVPYVRDARLQGSLFDSETGDGAVACADTDFYVDHGEPLETLTAIRESGVSWPFGNLPAGHEFLALVKSEDEQKSRADEGSSDLQD